MAEKKVSVRLSAVGGRQVRAELEGIGEAGAKGMGRLSREMEAANRRMAAFAGRARVVAATAAAAVAAAGIAMVRSGLQTVDAQAKLAQSLGTTVASIQILERAGDLAGVSLGQIEQASMQLTRRLSQAAAGTGPAVKALAQLGLTAAQLQAVPLDARIALIQGALADLVPEAQRAAVASQLFGDRAGLVFTRIDTATLRQATQDMRDFGVIVSQGDAAQIERTNDAISRLGLIWRGLSNQLAVAAAPALEAVADALAAAAKVTGPLGMAIQGLFGNLDRIITTAGTFAGLMAGRWVAGMLAAAFSVRGLATGLVVLKGALIRTGIGALIVGAGELVFQFTRLVRGAGGFGAAMGLLKNLAAEVWDRIGLGAAAAGAQIAAVFLDLKSDAAAGVASAIKSVVGFGNAVANTFEGAYEAVRAIWSKLPAALGDLMLQGANSVVKGVESLLNGIIARINRFIATINAVILKLPDWARGGSTGLAPLADVSLGDIANPLAGSAAAAGTAAADAFRRAFAEDPLSVPDLGLDRVAAEAARAGDAARQAATDLGTAAVQPLTSWQALKAAVTGAGTEGSEAIREATASTDGLTEAVTQAGKAAGSAKTAIVEQFGAVSKALAGYAKEAKDVAAQIGSSLVSAFRGAEDALVTFVTTGRFDFAALANSILADITRIALRSAILGPLAASLGGALGGGASGGGGLLAGILHDGGRVGDPAPARLVPAALFAGAPRMHSGGWAGLRPDEVPAILQRGERVLSRADLARSQTRARPERDARPVQIVMNVTTPNADSFRYAQGQIAADLARAMSRARRNL